jgi:hypothetical protein
MTHAKPQVIDDEAGITGTAAHTTTSKPRWLLLYYSGDPAARRGRVRSLCGRCVVRTQRLGDHINKFVGPVCGALSPVLGSFSLVLRRIG